jgi:serine/threonine protein kinase
MSTPAGLGGARGSGEDVTVECIATDELVAMIEGTLGRDRVDAVVAHVDACALCAEVVASLGAFEEDSRRVGRYQLERPVGSGGMGIVYAAWDPELERRVAVKLVRPERADEASRGRMLREARALAKISHPNVVAVHDAGEHDGDVYVATELVDGETLATWPAGRDAAEITAAWIQVARGLAAAHHQGVVHRDVKPANALVGRDGRVRIGDFGLARHHMGASEDGPAGSSADASASPWITAAGAVAGTPAYMAPEQRTGSVDARSDQFALCVSLAEALSGQRPAADTEVSLEPAALATALNRGLRSDPEARFPDVGALADALAAAIAPPPPRARRTALVAGMIGAIVTGSLVAWFATGSGAATCEVATVPADL